MLYSREVSYMVLLKGNLIGEGGSPGRQTAGADETRSGIYPC